MSGTESGMAQGAARDPAHGAASAWTVEVARYYDRNTGRFLLVGGGRGVHSMHRELWGPGVTSAREASDYVHRLLADEIARRMEGDDGARVIFDFGCGVGGTLFHLAERIPLANLTGVTVSTRQVDVARTIATARGVADRCAFVLGDFQEVDLGARADVIVAVESFAHAERASAFLANAARHLRPGGVLLVVDDFLATEPDALDARQRASVERFRVGWRVPAVCTPARLAEEAFAQGLDLASRVDLSSLVRPGSRVRDRLVAAVSPLADRLGLARIPFYGNVIGGNALQVGLREGFLRYELLALTKRGPGSHPGAGVSRGGLDA